MGTLTNFFKGLFNKPVLTLIIFGVLSRALLFALYPHVTLYPDSEGYDDLARLLTAFNLSGYSGERTPGYPLLMVLSGNSAVITVILQAIMGIATSYFLYKTMVLLHIDKKLSLLTTVFLNSLLHVFFYETAIFSESITLFFVTLIFYMLFDGFFTEKQSWKKTLLVGFLLGYLTLIKPFYIYMPFVIYGLYTLKHFSLKNIINQKIIILIFPLMVFLGWSYLNKVNTGHFVSTSYYGINIAQNCVTFAEKVPEEYKTISDIYVKYREENERKGINLAMTIWVAYDELLDKTGLTPIELSHELSLFSKAAIQQNPADYAKQVAVSWNDFWRTSLHFESLNNPNPVFKYIWEPQKLILRGLKIFFLLLIPYHFIKFIRTRKVTPEVIIASVILCTSLLQAMATFGTNSRYSFPFEFLMVIMVILSFRTRLNNLFAKFNN